MFGAVQKLKENNPDWYFHVLVMLMSTAMLDISNILRCIIVG